MAIELTEKLAEAVKHAQNQIDGICADILTSTSSLTQKLVRANRLGHDPEKAREAYKVLHVVVDEALAVYEAAIAQPEPKINAKSRITL